jgi:hypothetical protein
MSQVALRSSGHSSADIARNGGEEHRSIARYSIRLRQRERRPALHSDPVPPWMSLQTLHCKTGRRVASGRQLVRRPRMRSGRGSGGGSSEYALRVLGEKAAYGASG